MMSKTNDENASYYCLILVPSFKMGSTAAPIRCSLCGVTIMETGGPMKGAVCHPCADDVRSEKLVGVVKR